MAYRPGAGGAQPSAPVGGGAGAEEGFYR
jgi:hypothetical protein